MAGKSLQSKDPEQAAKLHRLKCEDNLMTISTFGFALITMASLGACPEKDLSSSADVSAPEPVRIVAEEPGVVPAGSSLVVQTDDAVTAVKAMRATIYTANVAKDVVDQNGTVLIPKDSPVELGVRSLPYLGPGGVGMTELILELRAVTVKDVRYPIAPYPSPRAPAASGSNAMAPSGRMAVRHKARFSRAAPALRCPLELCSHFRS